MFTLHEFERLWFVICDWWISIHFVCFMVQGLLLCDHPVLGSNQLSLLRSFFWSFSVGLCSGRAWWPLAPNFCPRATRKSQIFHTNHMLGAPDFTVLEHWAPFNFS